MKELKNTSRNDTVNNIQINAESKPVTIKREQIMDLEGTLINISPEISCEQHKEVVLLIKEYIEIFTSDPSKVKSAKVEPYHIRLKKDISLPKFNPPHRITPVQREKLKIQLDKLMNAGIIEHTSSSFAAPAFLVEKKHQELLD
jgi:hypothetical protein